MISNFTGCVFETAVSSYTFKIINETNIHLIIHYQSIKDEFEHYDTLKTNELFEKRMLLFRYSLGKIHGSTFNGES